ncbi:MAG TPA: sugar transferase [Anaerolineae bacterium]|nr:sugar transferase [Anaerolineae bacterium]
MADRRATGFAILLCLSDLALTAAALYAASVARVTLPWGATLWRGIRLNVQVYILALLVWISVFLLLSVYDPRRNQRFADELQTVLVGISVSTLVFAGTLYLTYRDVPRLLFLYFFVFDLFLLLCWRALLRGLLRLAGRSRQARRSVLVAGAGEVGQNVVAALQQRDWAGLEVVGFADDDPEKQGTSVNGFPVLGTLQQIPLLIEEGRIQEVIFALPLRAHQEVANLVVALQRLPVVVKVVPDFFDLAFYRSGITVDDLGGIPLLNLRASAIEGFPRAVKRAFDAVGATLALILLSPVMLLIAVLIKLDSRGPVIFSQLRIGENCQPFQMYKFRSMVADAESKLNEVAVETVDGEVVHKVRDDPRVTRVGRILRRASLDELPQLFNVIKGEMSVVGPRPELPFLVDKYEAWQRKRFAVPPGMTGWWQISGRSDRPMHLHVEDDLFYIQNYSLLLDLQILWKTVAAVLRRRGAF